MIDNGEEEGGKRRNCDDSGGTWSSNRCRSLYEHGSTYELVGEIERRDAMGVAVVVVVVVAAASAAA